MLMRFYRGISRTSEKTGLTTEMHNPTDRCHDLCPPCASLGTRFHVAPLILIELAWRDLQMSHELNMKHTRGRLVAFFTLLSESHAVLPARSRD